MASWKSVFQTELYKRVSAQLQVDGLNDVYFYFMSGLYTDSYEFPNKYINLVTGESQDNQPSDVFCICKFGRAATINRTIYKNADTDKEEPFFFMVSIYTPKELTDRKSDEIEESLDRAIIPLELVTSDIKISGNTRVAKFADPSEYDIQEVLRQKSISYNFKLEYCGTL